VRDGKNLDALVGLTENDKKGKRRRRYRRVIPR
jgi:hypothetical protein